MSSILSNLGMVIPIVAIVLVVVGLLVAGYVKASPDRAYIISGLRKEPKVLIGKAGIKIPFLEKKDELNLQLIPIDVKTSSAVPTADYININVDAAVNVKVSSDNTRLQLAAQNFLNKPVDYIGSVAREVLEGNMREIVGKMNLEEMVSDRQKFAELVKENAEPDLAAMGLDIVSFNVQNFVDENGVICKQVNDLLYLYGRDDFIHWCISEIHDEVFPRLYAKDEVVLKIKQDEIDRYIEEKNETMFTSPMCGKVCGFVFADRFVSELGNRLCKMHPEIDFVAMIDIDGCTVSYRTVKEDIDLGKDVASLFGGGGHPKAAGSEFSQSIKLKVIEEIFGQ